MALRGNLEGLNDEGEVVENYKVVKRLIGHQSGTIISLYYLYNYWCRYGQRGMEP